MWQLRCITTWGRPTPRQSFCALITKPITTHARAKFEIAQPIHCRFIAFYCWYVTWRCDLELWPRELMPIQTNVVILQSYLTKTTYFLHLRLQPPKKTAYTSYFFNTPWPSQGLEFYHSHAVQSHLLMIKQSRTVATKLIHWLTIRC